MANVTKLIGRVPVPRGEYQAGRTYYKYNLVQYEGSTYMSLTDGNTAAPATVGEDGRTTVGENWQVWSDASAVRFIENMLDELTVQHYFDMDVILAFILKLHIIDRWHLLDEQTGREMFRKLVDEVRGTFKGVDYNPGTAGAPEGSPARTDNN